MVKVRVNKIVLVILICWLVPHLFAISADSFVPTLDSPQLNSHSTLEAETYSPKWKSTTSADWTAVTISGDGSTILSVNDECISLFDFSSNTTLWNYNTSAWIYSQSLSDDGEKAVVGTLVNSQDILLFSRTSNETVWKSSCHGWVIDVAISGDGNTIAAVDWDNYIYVYDTSSNESLWKYRSLDQMLCVAVSTDGNTIVAGGKNNTVYVFDRSSNNTIWKYEMNHWVYGVDVSRSGNRIVASCSTSVCAFERNSNETLWEYTTNDLYGVSISGDGSTVVAGSSATYSLPNLYVFDYGSNETLWTFNTTNQLREIAISDDGTRIAAGGYDNHTYFFSKASNSTLISVDCGGLVYGIGISQNGTSFTCGAVGRTWFYQFDIPIVHSTMTTNDIYNTSAAIDVSVIVNIGSAPISTALLYYSPDNVSWTSIEMVNQTPLDTAQVEFNLSIGPFDEGSFFYFIWTNDSLEFFSKSTNYSIIIDGTSPTIGIPHFTPFEPTSSDTVEVQIRINDSVSGIGSAYLLYSTDNGSIWSSLTLSIVSGTNYSCMIPAFENGTKVQFTINATDNVGNVAILDNSGNSYTYIVVDSYTPTNTGTTSTPPDSPMTLILIGTASVACIAVIIVGYFRYQSKHEILHKSELEASSEVVSSSGENTDLVGD